MILGVMPWTSTTESRIFRDSPVTVNSTKSLWFMLFLSNFDHVKPLYLSFSFTVLKQSTLVSVSLHQNMLFLFFVSSVRYFFFKTWIFCFNVLLKVGINYLDKSLILLNSYQASNTQLKSWTHILVLTFVYIPM